VDFLGRTWPQTKRGQHEIARRFFKNYLAPAAGWLPSSQSSRPPIEPRPALIPQESIPSAAPRCTGHESNQIPVYKLLKNVYPQSRRLCDGRPKASASDPKLETCLPPCLWLTPRAYFQPAFGWEGWALLASRCPVGFLTGAGAASPKAPGSLSRPLSDHGPHSKHRNHRTR